MPYKHQFIYPDYYPKFACKCGDCRATCCHGWGITLTRDDYFKVMGTDASSELRRRLDIAFKPAENPSPTPERYAMISYNWLGKCPIQTEEGFCLLHRECGEGAIPEICRRYPRMIRTAPVHECCTSGSCECTLELLFSNDGKLTFTKGELTVFDENFEPSAASGMDASEYCEKRGMAFEIISDRRYCLDERIERLAGSLGAKLPIYTIDNDKVADLAVRLAAKSAALTEIFEDCGDFLGGDCDFVHDEKFDIYMEKLLANHIFYKSFPRSFEGATAEAEIADIICTRGLVEYFAAGYISKCRAESDSKVEASRGFETEKFIDVTAKLFRMIEHSRFDEIAAKFFLKP